MNSKSTVSTIRTPLTELVGVKHPIVQTGMGWVAGPRLVSATAEAGALGILASATMTLDELAIAIDEVRGRTEKPFGVNMRADAGDAEKRVDLLIKNKVAVASFALAPKRDLITKLQEAGVKVIPSIGAVRHAVKMQEWGVDAVMVQGGEGGGHTGAVPTSLLLPAVIKSVDTPVIAAGGFHDGRGLAAALAYGSAGIGMGTRFLLTKDSSVPEDIKRAYLEFGLDGTVVTTKADGVPHRLLRTDFVENLESSNPIRSLVPALARAMKFRGMSGMTWSEFVKEGLSMKKSTGRSWGQMMLAANTPMLLKAGLVDGDTTGGMLSSGQVVGVIDDLPSCEELVNRIVAEAIVALDHAHSLIKS